MRAGNSVSKRTEHAGAGVASRAANVLMITSAVTTVTTTRRGYRLRKTKMRRKKRRLLVRVRC